MLDELRRAAAGDKEFIVNELKKRIAELEAQIEELRQNFAKERDGMMAAQKELQAKHEQMVQDMRRDHQTTLQQLRNDHSQQVEQLNKAAERKLEL